MSALDWTEEEDAQLVRCRLAQMTFAETAAILGRTKKAAETRYYDIRAKRPQASPGDLYGLWTRAMDAVRAAQ